MYLTRYIEVLEKYIESAGDLPPGNKAEGVYIPNVIHYKLGRVSQAPGGTL